MKLLHRVSKDSGPIWMMPTLALPKLASQNFGAGFGHHGLAKILARIYEGITTSPTGSHKIGNKPNKGKKIWYDQ
jgi:hypothetical protein